MMITNEEIYQQGGPLNESTTEQAESLDSNETLKTLNLLSISHFAHSHIFTGILYPWEVIPSIGSYIEKYLSTFLGERRHNIKTIGSVYIEEDVVIGQGTTIEHGAMIKGPSIIGKNCEIRKGAYIRGNVITGDNCIIGNSCELKNCVVLDKALICHFNYVGDSVLGEGAHLSAGAITSNLKLDQTDVVIRQQDIGRNIDTGLKKFGAIVGDYSEVGCNVVLNPGTILGRKSVVYPCASIRGVVSAGCIVKVVQEKIMVLKA